MDDFGEPLSAGVGSSGLDEPSASSVIRIDPIELVLMRGHGVRLVSTQITAHLRDCTDLNGPAVQRRVKQQHRLIRAWMVSPLVARPSADFFLYLA